MNTRILESSVEFLQQSFEKPLQISTGYIHEITEARVSVRVRVQGRERQGFGSIYLSDLWGWPDATLSHETRSAAMRAICDLLASRLPEICGGEQAHALELGLRLHHEAAHITAPQENPPLLARLICASPFDAAIHDAVGQALNRSAFDLYDEGGAVPFADYLFPGRGAIEAIRSVLGSPRHELEAWYLVGLADSPQDIVPWVVERGYRNFKIKLSGQEPASDVAQTRKVFKHVRELGAGRVQLCIDSNCANSGSDSVLEYLERLEKEDSEAYAALQYIEQPTPRHILRHPVDWTAVSQRKPVFIDEGLIGFELFPAILEQRWGGLALKTCKGHSFALVAAAWAVENRLQLAMQDLTNPGFAAIHAALLTARLPCPLGIELNSPQYTPSANKEWLPRLDPFFNVRNGVHRLPDWNPVGLGTTI